jgi:hypothetical protein
MLSLISTSTALRLLQALSFVWAGLVLGISFLEAPVKFSAPTLTRAAGLDVGRHVFRALNRVEVGAAGGLLVLLLSATASAALLALGAAVLLIVAVQTLWLLPILREQATAIIEGDVENTEGHAHLGYVVLEAAKVGALGAIGGLAVA